MGRRKANATPCGTLALQETVAPMLQIAVFAPPC